MASSLTARWRKIKKRCSFSSSDRLVRSKSFTEQDVPRDDCGAEAEVERDFSDKYLTVGARDLVGLQGLRSRILQWNHDLKKRRSQESLSEPASREGRGRPRPSDETMFVLASHDSGGCVKSALVITSSTSTPYSTQSLKRRPPPSVRSSPWSSPPPSPSSSDCSSDRPCQRKLYQDQDSGYDGFCPEKSLYSTTSSDTSSLLSSDQEPSFREETYGRTPPRPRPSPIYEAHPAYRLQLGEGGGPLHQSTPLAKGGGQARALVCQATVVSLTRTAGQEPPPLPPRPVQARQLPPLPQARARPGRVEQGAVSLPRRRPGEARGGRRRGSLHGGKEGGGQEQPQLVITTEV